MTILNNSAATQAQLQEVVLPRRKFLNPHPRYPPQHPTVPTDRDKGKGTAQA